MKILHYLMQNRCSLSTIELDFINICGSQIYIDLVELTVSLRKLLDNCFVEHLIESETKYTI